MSDLTERLRGLDGVIRIGEQVELQLAAADRIDALEAALHKIATATEHLEIYNTRSEAFYEGTAAQAKIANGVLAAGATPNNETTDA